MQEEKHFHLGLRNVVAAQSGISKIDGERGVLAYRGYPIGELTAHSNYEETCFLLLYGRLPNASEFAAFSKRLYRKRGLESNIVGLVRSLAFSLAPIDLLMTAVSAMKANDSDLGNVSEEAEFERGLKLIALMPELVALQHRIREGDKSVYPTYYLPAAQNFLYMLHGFLPGSIEKNTALDKALIIHAEHDFNNSTFVARSIVSTGSDMYSGISGAIGALKGPLHGGANQDVLRFVKKLTGIDPKDIGPYIGRELDRGKKIPGLGHAVYRVVDPRAVILEKEIERLFQRDPGLDRRIFEILQEVRRVGERDISRYPNVDFYSAVLYSLLGISDDMFTPMFEVARVVGQVAHIIEERKQKKLIRPLSEYVGPDIREYSFVP